MMMTLFCPASGAVQTNNAQLLHSGDLNYKHRLEALNGSLTCVWLLVQSIQVSNQQATEGFLGVKWVFWVNLLRIFEVSKLHEPFHVMPLLDRFALIIHCFL